MTYGVNELLNLGGDAERLREDMLRLAELTDPIGKSVGVPLMAAQEALRQAEEAIALELGKALLGRERADRA